MKSAWRSLGRLRCAAVAAGMCLALAGCGGGEGGGSTPTAQTGSVSGVVVTAATGNAPVAGATVSTTAGTTTSGADGSFTVQAPVNDRAVIHVERAGFAEAFPVTRVTSGQITTIGVKLLPVGVTTPVTVANGGTVTVPNSTAQVDLPANGLVPKNGGAVAGTVNVSVTPIDPAVDPNLMPGDFTGVSAGGTTPIESFGAIVVDIRDNAGNRYNLAAGRTSTIRIPLGTQNPNPPPTIPLWYFDETTGLWMEQGTATLQGTTPNRYYEGTVNHFSAWNADDRLLRTWVEGCVTDANGQPVTDAWVTSKGIDYTGSDSDYTSANGTFRVGVRKGSSASISVARWSLNPFSYETISNAVTVTSSPNDPVDFVRRLPNCIVVNPGVLTITTQVLPGGNVGTAYNQTLAAAGGVPVYAWSLNAAADLTALSSVGLSLNAAGVIAGTPTAAGTITITVRVTDSVNGTVTKPFTFTISPAGVVPISITTLSPLPTGTVGTTYNLTLAATGGTGTKVWSDAGGLPVWLTLNPSTGSLSGTPTAQGSVNFTIQVQDSSNPPQTAQKQFSLTINPSSGGGGGGSGQLSVSNAPASVGGTFVVDPSTTVARITSTPPYSFVGIGWGEVVPQDFSHIESLGVSYDQASGQPTASGVAFVVYDNLLGSNPTYTYWYCYDFVSSCNITVNTTARTVTFNNSVLSNSSTGVPAVTLNGTLSYPVPTVQ